MTAVVVDLIDTVTATYQGFPLVITDRDVTVYGPQGRRLYRATSVKKARLFIRGYRKASKEEL
jgi:hypothetical protein